MRRLNHLLALAGFLLLSGIASAQGQAQGPKGEVLFQRDVRIPREAVFGDETLRGTYTMALTDIDGKKWFVLSKGGQEVGRDPAIEIPAKELPTSGLQAEVLKGGEYYRVRVRKGDTVYLIHFLLKGGDA